MVGYFYLTYSVIEFTLSDFVSASPFVVEAATKAKYVITFFVFSVFPAPDSPLYALWKKQANYVTLYIISLDTLHAKDD